MTKRRIVWYLESHKLITNVQCVFKVKRSTIDYIVRFETFCRDVFIHNQQLFYVRLSFSFSFLFFSSSSFFFCLSFFARILITKHGSVELGRPPWLGPKKSTL